MLVCVLWSRQSEGRRSFYVVWHDIMKKGLAATNTVADIAQKSNEWSKYRRVASSYDMALAEWDKFEDCCELNKLPEMEPTRVVGCFDDVGQPKEPVYVFGKVTSRGSDLNDEGLNHADYVNSAVVQLLRNPEAQT